MNKYTYIPNFKPSEFKCPCGCNNEPDMDEKLLVILQFIRSKYGKPVNITSGYRCQTHNDSLTGSVKNSDHIQFKAADFYITNVTNNLANRKEIINLVRFIPGFKYGYCNGYILYANGTWKEYNAPWMGSSIHISVK